MCNEDGGSNFSQSPLSLSQCLSQMVPLPNFERSSFPSFPKLQPTPFMGHKIYFCFRDRVFSPLICSCLELDSNQSWFLILAPSSAHPRHLDCVYLLIQLGLNWNLTAELTMHSVLPAAYLRLTSEFSESREICMARTALYSKFTSFSVFQHLPPE